MLKTARHNVQRDSGLRMTGYTDGSDRGHRSLPPRVVHVPSTSSQQVKRASF